MCNHCNNIGNEYEHKIDMDEINHNNYLKKKHTQEGKAKLNPKFPNYLSFSTFVHFFFFLFFRYCKRRFVY